MSEITIALSKGRILGETLPLLARLGIVPQDDPDQSRKLILETNQPDIRLIIVRASDVPCYVKHGAADLGVVGKDILYEQGSAGLYQPVDLKIGCCRMVVAAHEDFDFAAFIQHKRRIRVASKYAQMAANHFADQGIATDMIKLYGSMELAPLVGLADVIVDLVSTGATLRANRLRVVEEIMPISSQLIVNQAAFKLKHAKIRPMLDFFAREVT